jgi:hypothetical protein
MFGFLHPKRFVACSNTELLQQAHKLKEQFPSELSFQLASELIAFRDIFFQQVSSDNSNFAGVLPYLKFILESDQADVYPQMEVLLRLFLTLPIGIASAERSFSVLRRLKNYLRSTMGQQRLTSLAILAIERKVSEEVQLTNVLSEFASAKARRGFRQN